MQKEKIVEKNITWLINFIFQIFLFLPRNKKIWIFGAWEGEKYSDNSRYFYEYLFENNIDKKIKLIWITSNKKLISEVKNCYYSNSMKGIFYKLRAGVVFYTNGIYDLGKYDLSNGAYRVSLWHGMPLKKIYFSSNDFTQKEGFKAIMKKIKWKLYNPVKRDLTISTSKEMNEKLIKCFNIKDENIVITGQPRNDILISYRDLEIKKLIKNKDLFLKIKDKKVVSYIPTYRANEILNKKLYERINSIINNKKLNKLLIENNSIFLIKLHYLMEMNIQEKNTIKIINDRDIDSVQGLLKVTDILITDYSSVFIDFVLQENKKLIFYGFDLKEYLNNDTGIFYNYETIFECSVKTEENLIKKIEELLKVKSGNVKEINYLFNKESKDFKNFSKKVYEEIKKRINL